MANETITKGECYVCDGSVAFKADKNGKAYYACGHCGTRVFLGAEASEALKSSVTQQQPAIKEKAPHVQATPRKEAPIVATGNDAGKPTTGDDGAKPDVAGKPSDGGRRNFLGF